MTCAMRMFRRLRRREPEPSGTPPQGEEYEIEKAEREAQRERDTFANSLIEKAGHSQFPFLKDPPE